MVTKRRSSYGLPGLTRKYIVDVEKTFLYRSHTTCVVQIPAGPRFFLEWIYFSLTQLKHHHSCLKSSSVNNIKYNANCGVFAVSH